MTEHTHACTEASRKNNSIDVVTMQGGHHWREECISVNGVECQL